MTKRSRRTFTKEFKEQIVQLHLSGKPRSELIKEYELTPSSFDKWVVSIKQVDPLKKKTTELLNYGPRSLIIMIIVLDNFFHFILMYDSPSIFNMISRRLSHENSTP
jgi:hypothetical protein